MPHQKPSVNQLAAMRGKPIYASDGDKIGNIDEIYYDESTGEPEWIGVKSGFLGMKRLLVPAVGAQPQDGEDLAVRVPYPKDRINEMPDIDEDDEDNITEESERRLYLHYGLQPSERRSETILPEGRTEGHTEGYMPARPPIGREGEVGLRQHEEESQVPEGWARGTFPTDPETGEVSVSRHEAELQVGKREVERGRARLRKWVETEPVSEEVQLRREAAYLEREQVDRPAPGAQLGEQEVEMTLYEEQPVVEKEPVEKERLTLRKEEETRRETVSGEAREEQVEVDGDVEEEHRPDQEHRHR